MSRVALIAAGGFLLEGKGYHVPFLEDLATSLARRVDLHVYTSSPPGGIRGTTRLGDATIHFLENSVHDPLFSRSREMLFAPLADHRQTPYDLFHGIWALPAGGVAVTLGRLLNRPSVVSLHGGETANLPDIGYGNFRNPFQRWLTRWTIRNSAAVICLSRTQVSALERVGIERRDLCVIPPAPSPIFFGEPEDHRIQPESTSRKEIHLLNVASITPVKDHRTLLQAFAIVRRSARSRLRIVGPDYSGGEITALAKDLGLADSVEFTGYLPHDRVPDQYRWGDILVVSSRHEAFPVSVAEAAASGLAICGTAVGGIEDLAPESAVSVPVGDPKALASAILHIAADQECRTRLSESARRWASDHRLPDVAERIGTMYDAVLDRSRTVQNTVQPD